MEIIIVFVCVCPIYTLYTKCLAHLVVIEKPARAILSSVTTYGSNICGEHVLLLLLLLCGQGLTVEV